MDFLGNQPTHYYLIKGTLPIDCWYGHIGLDTPMTRDMSWLLDNSQPYRPYQQSIGKCQLLVVMQLLGWFPAKSIIMELTVIKREKKWNSPTPKSCTLLAWPCYSDFLRPPRGSVKLLPTYLTNLVPLEQFHHKPITIGLWWIAPMAQGLWTWWRQALQTPRGGLKFMTVHDHWGLFYKKIVGTWRTRASYQKW